MTYPITGIRIVAFTIDEFPRRRRALHRDMLSTSPNADIVVSPESGNRRYQEEIWHFPSETTSRDCQKTCSDPLSRDVVPALRGVEGSTDMAEPTTPGAGATDGPYRIQAFSVFPHVTWRMP
jgi:hypothetical protein